MTARWCPRTTLAALALGVAACGGQAAEAPAPAPEPAATAPAAPPIGGTLYRRLGGYDALAAVTDDFLRRVLSDAELVPFFEDLTPPEKARLRQMLVDQLCEMTGGPCVYVGQDMQTAHQGLDITARDWDRAVVHLTATLNYFRVRPRERDEVLGAVSRLRDEIVQRQQ